METFSAFLALCEGNTSVAGEFSSQRPVAPSFDTFFDLRLNTRLSKQSWRRLLNRVIISRWYVGDDDDLGWESAWVSGIVWILYIKIWILFVKKSYLLGCSSMQWTRERGGGHCSIGRKVNGFGLKPNSSSYCHDCHHPWFIIMNVQKIHINAKETFHK